MLVNNLNKSIGNMNLLVDISFDLSNSDKVGLIGKNGSGKSTLLKILAGLIKPDSGSINLDGNTIKLLKQEIEIEYYNYSVLKYIKNDCGLLELEKRLHELENNLNEEKSEEYGEIMDTYLKCDGYAFETNLEIILNGLNFDININSKMGELSGGQKIKVMLASLLLTDADILLLDEPTNNLDIAAIEWLENYLNKLNKKMIIVSHDDYFLNTIANKIINLDDGKITEFNMSYSDYLLYKEHEYNRELDKYERSKERQKKIQESIQSLKGWTSKGLSKKKNDHDKLAANYLKERTKKTSSKVSRLKKELEKIEIDKSFKKKKKIDFSANYFDSKENRDIQINDLVCGYDSFFTKPISLHIPFGSRVSINGKNGSGKTTFIKTLIGEMNSISGNVLIGSGVKFGYISQESLSVSDKDYSVYDYLSRGADVDDSLLFNILNKFNINFDERNKLFSSLSPGQRTRVNLAKLAINEVNTLVLDEATNHLDIEAIHVLEEVVESFNGTIISVSHNRNFNKLLNAEIILDIETGLYVYNSTK